MYIAQALYYYYLSILETSSYRVPIYITWLGFEPRTL